MRNSSPMICGLPENPGKMMSGHRRSPFGKQSYNGSANPVGAAGDHRHLPRWDHNQGGLESTLTVCIL